MGALRNCQASEPAAHPPLRIIRALDSYDFSTKKHEKVRFGVIICILGHFC